MNIQIVDINQDVVKCEKCGANIVDLANFIYEGIFVNTSIDRRDYCHCRHCFSPFFILYPIFDPQGHVYPSIFCEDINDLSSNWLDYITDEQKKVVADHLLSCRACRDRLNYELLTDGLLRAMLRSLRSRLNKPF